MKDPLLGQDFLQLLTDLDASPEWRNAPRLALSLHREQPTTQTDAEADYPGYARILVARRGTWRYEKSATGGRSILIASVSWPRIPADAGTPTNYMWAALGLAASGPGRVFYPIKLAHRIPHLTGIVPGLDAGSLIIDEA